MKDELADLSIYEEDLDDHIKGSGMGPRKHSMLSHASRRSDISR